jgi:hypothetical protein
VAGTSLMPRCVRRMDRQVRGDISVALLARHVLEAMEMAMRDWTEDRVDDPMGHVRLMLGLAFQGVTKR